MEDQQYQVGAPAAGEDESVGLGPQVPGNARIMFDGLFGLGKKNKKEKKTYYNTVNYYYTKGGYGHGGGGYGGGGGGVYGHGGGGYGHGGGGYGGGGYGGGYGGGVHHGVKKGFF